MTLSSSKDSDSRQPRIIKTRKPNHTFDAVKEIYYLCSYSYSNLVRQTTDGETIPTTGRAVRRVDATSIESEVVTCQTSRPIEVNGRSRRGPIVAIDAKRPDRAKAAIDISATDELVFLVGF